MGGGSSKSSSSSSNTTYDNDIMVGEGAIALGDDSNFSSLEAGMGATVQGSGSVLADELGTVNSNSNNISLSDLVGNTLSIDQFGDNAASTVSQALQTVENITSKNLQLQTDKDVLTEELNAENALTFDDLKEFFSSTKVQIVTAVVIVLIVIFSKKGKK